MFKRGIVTYTLTIENKRPSLKIIAMSSRPEAKHQAFDAGIDAFMNKSEPPERVMLLLKVQLKKWSEENETDMAN
ncbi:MAG: hypothetical protein KDE48_15755 [Anaerolineales bacterium]|nr:hypothetical protein [Anaerolineales bacterium]